MFHLIRAHTLYAVLYVLYREIGLRRDWTPGIRWAWVRVRVCEKM
jgi:hypothetical protein